jgi:membrane protein implicated in regulation of membrane protease activity
LIFILALFLAVFVLPSPWGLVAVVVGGFVEVGETWFWLRYSKRRRIMVGAETLIGRRAVTASDCRPRGQVRLDGEFWEATCEAGADAGVDVRVVGRHGLTLAVEPE